MRPARRPADVGGHEGRSADRSRPDRRPLGARPSAPSVRPHTTTSAPAARNASAIPRPIPLDPPVTTTDPSGEVERSGCAGEIERGHSCLPVSDWYCPDAVSDHAECVPALPPAMPGASWVGRPSVGAAPNRPEPAMPITSHQKLPGIAEVVIDHPPVNALDVAGWFELADAVTAAGRVPDNRVVIVRAEGRGFCAGVDIKEIQALGDEALIGANRGCFAAFAAVYECEVPVIAAVHGFCLGGGIGIVGNSDIVVASDDATFGLPEVDRGALGAATHLSRLVPQHRMRSMVYTATAGHRRRAARATDRCSGWSPGTELRGGGLRGGRRHRRQEPDHHPPGQGVPQRDRPGRREGSYRFEQGFTYELHVAGVADEQRAAFVEKRGAEPPDRADTT